MIKNATVEDAGTYVCTAPVKIESKINIHVVHIILMLFLYLSSVPPVIVFSPQSNSVISKGEPLSLSCIASGFPVPNVTWLVDGMGMASSPRLSVNGSYFSIQSAIVNDSGVYTCVAVNTVGSTSHSINIEVLEITGVCVCV